MHQQGVQHSRKRSQTLPDPNNPVQPPLRYPLPDQRSFNITQNQSYRNIDGFMGGHSLVAATVQGSVFPRSPQYSPGISDRPPPVPEKDAKPAKEKSKMKLFSKPKSIGIHKDKDFDKKHPALPSPGKMSLYSISKMSNASTSSLIEPPMSSAASLYSNANGSTSTLVPGDRGVEKEKEKHKHNFLSRQKNKLWDKDDFHLPLSSASSTSKPTDPNAHPLYSFTPSSLANPSAFAKTVSGLDLRHGARALREKKKEERAGSSLSTTTTYLENTGRERENSFGNSEWPITTFSSTTVSISNASQNLSTDFGFSPAEVANLGATFGVPGITPDDAWPLLRTRLHNVFEGEDPRPPIEDFNSLVSVHLRRCIQRRSPATMIEDVSDLLKTGFTSLSATLKSVPDERLVPHLVAMWSLVFHTVLPFLQAVFLPLDLEFKGRGPVMSAREAADFWGVALPDDGDAVGAGTGGARDGVPLLLAEDLDVRRMVLLTFRDTIFLPRYDALMAIFSRLSLESIDAGVPSSPLPPLDPPPPLTGGGGAGPGEGGGGGGSGTASPRRPGTASSNDAALSSLTSPAASFSSSAAGTLMGGGGPVAGAGGPVTAAVGRSRATSSTSAGSWASAPTTYGGSGSSGGPPAVSAPGGGSAPGAAARRGGENGVGGLLYAQQVLDTGARVTDMVGRMLQCVSVLASVHSGDEAQGRMESLTKTLKWNWLGRGRTGRQRRGFVGTKVGAKFRGEVEVGS
jgi:hypothetical protein